MPMFQNGLCLVGLSKVVYLLLIDGCLLNSLGVTAQTLLSGCDWPGSQLLNRMQL